MAVLAKASTSASMACRSGPRAPTGCPQTHLRAASRPKLFGWGRHAQYKRVHAALKLNCAISAFGTRPQTAVAERSGRQHEHGPYLGRRTVSQRRYTFIFGDRFTHGPVQQMPYHEHMSHFCSLANEQSFTTFATRRACWFGKSSCLRAPCTQLIVNSSPTSLKKVSAKRTKRRKIAYH